MPPRDQTKRSRGMAKTPSSTQAEWLPWGLYDHNEVPELSVETVQEAAKQLNVTDEAKTSELRDRLRYIAVTYWRFHRDVVRPGPKWLRDRVARIKKATERLYQLIHNQTGGIGLTPLASLTQLRMQRPLGNPIVGGPLEHSESIEQLLKNFTRVCDECLRKKGAAGAKKQKHLHIAAKDIVELWKDYTGKPLGLSLDTEVGPSGTEFFYPGPRFVHFMLKAIDPQLDLRQTATALRETLGTPRRSNLVET